MFREERTFQGHINTDDDSRVVPQGDYRNFEYCRLGNTQGKGQSVIQSAGSILSSNPSIQPEDQIMGTALWQKRNSIVYYILKVDGNCQIWNFNLSDDTHTLVAESTAFNWDANFPVYDSDIEDDLLKLTDGRWDDLLYTDEGQALFNEPQQLNLQKALDGEYPVIDLQVIQALKWPPPPPIAVYATDETHFDNKLRRKLFRFRYRYIYENSEITVWSVWSNLALPTQSEFISGTNWGDSQTDNAIDLTIFTGPNVVKGIEVCVQQLDANLGGVPTPFGIFIEYNKAEDSINDNENFVIRFFGDAATKPVSFLSENTNSYRLPRNAKRQVMLPTVELSYINFREGFDLPELDVESSHRLSEINWQPVNSATFATIYTKISGLDEFDFRVINPNLSTELVFFAGQTIVLTYPVSSTQTATMVYTVTQFDIEQAVLNYPSSILDQNKYMMMIIGDYFSVLRGGTPTAPTLPSTLGDSIKYVNYFEVGGTGGSFAGKVERQTNVQPSLKTGAFHPIGIVYLDDAKREFTVATNEDLNLFVPFYGQDDTGAFQNPNNPYTVNAVVSLNHLPPKDARYYLFVGQKSNILNFSQYVINCDPNVSGTNNAIWAEGNRFVISLDKYYVQNNIGATINHQIEKGNMARFYRQRITATWTPVQSAYLTDYFELEVLEFRPTGGDNGRPAIVVEQFDLTLISTDQTYKGQTIEIYTPRPTLDDDGNLFVSEWRDVSPLYEIGNPHTENRFHKGLPYYSGLGIITGEQAGTDSCTLIGNWSESSPDNLIGRFITITGESGDIYYGEVTAATFSPTFGLTEITVSGVTFTTAEDITWTASLDQDQIVTGGTSAQEAIIELTGYSDVYVRQRIYGTGYNQVTNVSRGQAYYYIEDPHYSDYWLSDYHPFGRLELESPTAELKHRKASAIHSDPFLIGTGVNGLSTFSVLGDNIEDLDPQFGEITAAMLSGREQKTLKLLQEQKENSIYIKHYPTDAAVPTGDLKITEKTFASVYPYKETWGCSNGGAAILLPNGSVMYFDLRSGAFILSSGGGSSIVSEIDPHTGRNYNFRKKTKELTDRVRQDPSSLIRTYINPLYGEVGFAFSFNNETEFDIVVFDYLTGGWRSEYYYNFRWFETFGNIMVSFGVNNQLYKHNFDNSITFNGETFIPKIKFVSNEQPNRIKRYQNMTTKGDKTFDAICYTDGSQSYGVMRTEMPSYLWTLLEDYSYVEYKRNVNDPSFTTPEMAMMNGEEMRADALTHELSYTPQEEGDKFVLFSVEIKGVLS